MDTWGTLMISDQELPELPIITHCLRFTENEVEKIIKGLKDASPGLDDIHAKIVKSIVSHHVLLDIFTNVLNISVWNGVFPLNWN